MAGINLDQDDCVRIAGQLATILRALHSIQAGSLGVESTPANGVENWARMYVEIREKLFQASASTWGDEFFITIAQAYEPDGQKLAPLLARASFYRSTFALEEALDGVKHQDASAYKNGMKNYV